MRGLLGAGPPPQDGPLAYQSPRRLADGTGLGKLPASTWLCLSTLGSSWDHFYSLASKFVLELKAHFPGEF